MFEDDGSLMTVSGFNENNGDNLNFALLLSPDQLNASNIKLTGTNANDITVSFGDGSGTFYPAFELKGAVSSDGILTGASAPISQTQLTTVAKDWLSNFTMHT